MSRTSEPALPDDVLLCVCGGYTQEMYQVNNKTSFGARIWAPEQQQWFDVPAGKVTSVPKPDRSSLYPYINGDAVPYSWANGGSFGTARSLEIVPGRSGYRVAPAVMQPVP